MLAIIRAESAATGKESTGLFHTLDAGNTAQFGAPGTVTGALPA
jgi:hypothetical protein